MTRNESIKIGENLASVCFGTAHEHHNSVLLLAMPIDHAYCRPCAFCSIRTTGQTYTGKDRQQMHTIMCSAA